MENLLNFDSGLMYWTWITFIVVLVILGSKAWKPMIKALENRENFIRESLEEAEAARQEADKVALEYEAMVAKARQEAQNIVAAGKETAERMKADILNEAQDKSAGILKQAEIQIVAEREKAIAEIRTQIVDISMAAAEKIIAKSLTPEDNERLIEDALKDYGKN
ncbi:MAG: F0F1 ATP synthase subunit B [Candidatus Marinimicrobia bacterium]|jgi:F-type H+-transporting ATPase subunit b|nr:F0F1 ATP synthase subunit B [Candidatus Neomarinimicrobiota bacterium]MBT3632602.1 F0F1 ATP synthase subunit B [Candidatus Neomarinimicrobiota bacterium]MBT3824494.1 F0F1 ATP synthase subunit B [Candidatus Neomarinimicrobiota bacterium]MBT4129161.1 F0F1 ATP synthase subunit B [Candidatus Neomarinimicrobiota bacterium]MBT4295208.1 F0F1 ATP synthase subunit B [Candidatus Neomarinimicrobiota bacterium]